MKIRYDACKNKRIKKGYTKIEGYKYKNFVSVSCKVNSKTLWWSYNSEKWFFDFDIEEYTIKGFANSYNGVDNVKQLRRFAKKHSIYLPKGTILILRSRFYKQDIYCTL